MARTSTAKRPSAVVKTPSRVTSGGSPAVSRASWRSSAPSGSSGTICFMSGEVGSARLARTACACARSPSSESRPGSSVSGASDRKYIRRGK